MKILRFPIYILASVFLFVTLAARAEVSNDAPDLFKKYALLSPADLKPGETPKVRRKKKRPANTSPSATIETQELPPVPQSPEEEASRLTKNWGGFRKTLSEKGVDLALVYKEETNSNFHGGVERRTVFLGNLDLRVALDAEKIAGWRGGSAFIYVLGNHGGDPSKYVGDAQFTSNIDAPADTVKFYEAWFQQLFHDDQVSLLVGLHDLNAEFYVTDTSGLFFNSSFGVGRELSQTGLNGPSIFPVTAPAIRLRAEASKSFNLQIAAFNAVSGDPHDPIGTHVRLDLNDGQLLIAEAAYLPGKEDPKPLPAKYAIGTWAYTATFDHQTATNDQGATPVKAPSHGAYVLADQTLIDGLSAFLRYGLASTEVNRFGSNLSGGLVFTGLIPQRPKDRLGFAFTQVKNGSEYKNKQQQLGVATQDAETTLEANYRIELIAGIALQPDLQYVMDPNTDPALSNALVGAVRIELSF